MTDPFESPEPIVWVSTKEASKYLGVNLRTLYRFIDEGELSAYKFGRVIRLWSGNPRRHCWASGIINRARM